MVTRKPMHVDPVFEEKVKEIQRKIMLARGENVSLRKLTGDIIKQPTFQEIEKRLIGDKNMGIELNIKLDGRLLE